MESAPRSPAAGKGEPSAVPFARPKTDSPIPSDQDLLEGVRVRSEASFEALVKRFWSRLEHFARGILRDDDQARDAVQEVFIRVWDRGTSLPSSGSVAAYLYTITRNVSLNARRGERARTRREQVRAERRLAEGRPRRPDQVLDETVLREEVAAAIADLPERRREVFTLARFHGLSYQEVADVLGVSPQTVANQMSSALAQLREMLSHRLE
jgi:RNA polymerase sigma-70 factor (family 1)